jgi:heme/copper-type cytochrome/quinol oxidase subunit 4
MAPKPKPARFEFTVGMVLAMALTILAVMTWVKAAPSSSLIYHPQLLLLY